jgi:hypothetical protein
MILPNFIIGGERRSGTTSLARWIEGHPQIYLRQGFDKAYFLETEVRGKYDNHRAEADAANWERTHTLDEYASFFSGAAGYKAIGEKSSDYLFWQPAHERLARYVPKARFLFVLRNPVDRAWSQYWNEVGKGRETLSFDQALRAEDERCSSSAYARNNLSFRTRGYYDVSLAHFMRYFPREQILVLTLEQIKTRADASMKRILEFLDVDADNMPARQGSHYNANWTMIPRPWASSPFLKPVIKAYAGVSDIGIKLATRDKYRRRKLRMMARSVFSRPAQREEMDPSTRAMLGEIYAPHIEKLEQLLDRPFTEWK